MKPHSSARRIPTSLKLFAPHAPGAVDFFLTYKLYRTTSDLAISVFLSPLRGRNRLHNPVKFDFISAAHLT